MKHICFDFLNAIFIDYWNKVWFALFFSALVALATLVAMALI